MEAFFQIVLMVFLDLLVCLIEIDCLLKLHFDLANSDLHKDFL
jgi:hypothetical protein